MGWIISVGRAGAASGKGQGQAMSLRFDGEGTALQLKVRESAGRPADPVLAWQAQRVWQKVLSTVVGFD